MLLHELCICSDKGASALWQAEHENQSVKHAGNKGMLVLAKKVSQIIFLMRFESYGAYGMGLNDDGLNPDQCAPQKVFREEFS